MELGGRGTTTKGILKANPVVCGYILLKMVVELRLRCAPTIGNCSSYSSRAVTVFSIQIKGRHYGQGNRCVAHDVVVSCHD